MDMRVIYHLEDGTWWAESPDVAGFTAVGEALPQLRREVREALSFYLSTDEFELFEQLANGEPVRELTFMSEVLWFPSTYVTTVSTRPDSSATEGARVVLRSA